MFIPEEVSLNYYELIITEECNLRCKYCYDDHYCDRSKVTDKKANTSMQIEMIPDLIKFIEITKADEQIEISLFGGEPSVNWTFVTSLIEELKKTNIDFRLHLNTNLTLFDSKDIDFLIENNIQVGVSLDGKREVHDRNRYKIDKSGSWNDTMKRLPELMSKSHQYNKQVAGLFVVHENNYKDFADSYDFLVKIGLHPNIQFNFSMEITDEMIESLYNQMIYLFKVKKQPLFNGLLRTLNKDNDSNHFCFTPQSNVSISPNGQLIFCHQMFSYLEEAPKDFNYFYGDIFNGYTNNSFFDVMKARTDFNKFKVNKDCENCKAAYWCNGGCVAGHEQHTNSLEELNPNLCKISLLLTDIAKEITE